LVYLLGFRVSGLVLDELLYLRFFTIRQAIKVHTALPKRNGAQRERELIWHWRIPNDFKWQCLGMKSGAGYQFRRDDSSDRMLTTWPATSGERLRAAKAPPSTFNRLCFLRSTVMTNKPQRGNNPVVKAHFKGLLYMNRF
jgi:hypothetical protein